jgi:hypothetical protein
MSDDNRRLSKIASVIGEEERLKNLSHAAEVRRDIEETLGHDVVNQDKLEQIAERVWLNVPVEHRATYTAEAWRQSIYDRCSVALKSAEERLSENKSDEKMFIAKVKTLRNGFAQQVVRAMQTVSDKYQQR